MSSVVARLGPRLFLLLAGTALGILLLVYLLRAVNLDQLGASFSNVDYRYAIVAIVPFLANLLFKVPRWALLFGEDSPGWDTLFGAMNVGYAINALLPLRLGEIVRAYWIRDRAGIPMVRALSTIALERVIDGVTLILMFLVMLPTAALPKVLLGPALTIGALFFIALGVMISLVRASHREEHPLTRMLLRLEHGRSAPLARIIRQTVTGLYALRDPWTVLAVAGYTVIIWGSNAVFVWLVVRAFHIDVPFTAGILLVSVLNLGMAVPSSPGYIGQFEALMVLTLAIYGIHRAPALACALALHAWAFVPVTIIGLIYLARVGLDVALAMVRSSATRSDRPSIPIDTSE